MGETTVRRSPLDAAHRALGAKMVPFGGWEMPLEYEGTLAEHRAVREEVGLFDVSHLGSLRVEGPGAGALLDRAFTNRFADLAPGRARYTLMCNEDGGIVDDLIGYRIAPERFLVVPNAANTDEVRARLEKAARQDAQVTYLGWVILAVQGPRSRDALEASGIAPGLAGSLGYMRCANIEPPDPSSGEEIAIARSGYTGEIGFEILAPPERGPALWDRLLEAVREAGGRACGLGARDTLRLEMGYPLHGNDIGPDVTPAEVGLEWAVAAGKPSFAGKEALAGRPPRSRLVGIRMQDRLIPRRGHPVLREGRPVGRVTSGTFSPTLRAGIALAALEPDASAEGSDVEVDVRGKHGRGQVVRPPFVERSPRG